MGFLFAIFDIAYIFSPYWKLPRELTPGWLKMAARCSGFTIDQLRTPACWALMLALTAGGLLWAYLAAGAVRWGGSSAGQGQTPTPDLPRSNLGWGIRPVLWLLGAVVLLLLIINARALVAPVPWSGDEDYHIKRTWKLANSLCHYALPTGGLLLLGVLYILFVWRYAGNKAQVACVGAAIALMQGALLFRFESVGTFQLPRYPYLEVYADVVAPLIGSFIVKVSYPWKHTGVEALFRVVPFISCALLAFIAGWKLTGHRFIVRLLLALAVGTTPLIFYYSSVLYLEQPALLAMTIVCFAAPRLLKAAPQDMIHEPAWYVLLLIPFMKETTFPFLLAFMGCRLMLVMTSSGNWRISSLFREAINCACIIAPLAIYLAFRSIDPKRRFVPHPNQLWHAWTYDLVGRAYVEQFGPLLCLAIIGLGVMLFRRRWALLFFLAMAWAADSGLHLLDMKGALGYSRFNLFVVPMLVVAVWYACDAIGRKSAIALVTILIAVIGANFYFSPIYADGTKVPRWGEYLMQTSENYFPYPQALRYLNSHAHGQTFMLTGNNYKYFVDIYLKKDVECIQHLRSSDWNQDDVGCITAALGEAAAWNGQAGSGGTTGVPASTTGSQHCQWVLYQYFGHAPPGLRDAANYHLEKIFRNDAHVLLLFRHEGPWPVPAPLPADVSPDLERPGNSGG